MEEIVNVVEENIVQTSRIFQKRNQPCIMKKIIIIYLAMLFIACSPYKKIIVSMSEMQTKNWLDKSEDEVVMKLGPFKNKTIVENGYKLFFDYSTYRVPVNISSSYSYTANVPNYNMVNNKGRLVSTSNSFASTPIRTNASPLLEIVKERTLYFFFDKDRKVSYVLASGYPDSIRYELRK